MPTVKLQIQEDQRTLSRINTKQINKRTNKTDLNMTLKPKKKRNP